MSDDICIVPGCDRIRDKKQNRKICQMHRVRFGRYKSYDLPTAPKLPDGILKICKRHGELTALQVYKRAKGKDWLSCRQCIKDCGRRFDKRLTANLRNSYRKNFLIKGTTKKITKEYYLQMLSNQGNVCAICKKPESIINSPTNGSPKRLAIDHCHKAGVVRGLLCHKCNVSIGSMHESIELLEAAIQYLKLHQP